MSEPDPNLLSPTDFRDIPVTDVGHPLADRIGSFVPEGSTTELRWVATETRSRVVRLSPIRLNFLATAERDGRRALLISDELSRLTLGFTRIWRTAGAGWVVREPDGGLRNGFDGRRLERLEDVWTLPPPTSIDDLAVNHLRPVPADALQLTVMVALRHPARATTRLGLATARLAEAVLGRLPEAWGPSEPAGTPWDPDALTEVIREQMPDEATVVVAGPGLAGTVSGRRTRHGVEEMTQLTLTLEDPTAERIGEARTALDAALQQLAESSMPLVAVALARPGSSDLLVSPHLTPPPLPLTLLIGAPAVRGFGIDLDRMRERFGARTVGRPRIPALLVDLGPLEPEAWTRLDAVLAQLDPAQLAEAFGLGEDALRSAQWDRPTDGGDRAEP